VIDPPFERHEVTIAPGERIAALDDDWTDALVVVEEGQVELVGRHGARLHIGVGGVLWLSGLALRALRNPGDHSAVLSAVRRVP
jgi:hypothetical protein